MNEELERMVAHAKSKGLGPESVDSVYLRGPEAIKEHERRNGYDKEDGPAASVVTSDGTRMKSAPDKAVPAMSTTPQTIQV